MTGDTNAAQPGREQRAIGSPDGVGWYGVLTETPAGLLCHECGWEGTHLGLHAYKSHGLRAIDYKRRHGLRLSQGLIVAAVRQRMSQIRTENPNPYLAAARDPAAARPHPGTTPPRPRHRMRRMRKCVLPAHQRGPAPLLQQVLRQPPQPPPTSGRRPGSPD